MIKAIITKEILSNISKLCKDNWDEESKKIIDLVVAKNHDYGDAWQRYGIFTPLIRINDKILRVQTLSTGEQALVADENIADTLKDIVGYGMLALEFLRVNGALKILTPEERIQIISKMASEDDEDIENDELR